jgi:alpha-beta hydrolase superfamily lysophospholipase
MLCEIVELRARDGVELHAAYWPAAAPGAPGPDAILLLPGSFGTFYSDVLRRFATALAAAGYACLTLSTRGHDMLWRSANGKLMGNGAEIPGEAHLDVSAALDEVERRGHRRIAYLGHSLGGIKGYHLHATRPDQRVVAFVSLSGPRWRFGSIRPPEENPLAGIRAANLARAASLIAKGRGDEPVLFDTGTQQTVYTARAFVDLYSDDRYDMLRHAPNIRIPILALRGGAERHVIPDGVHEAMREAAIHAHPCRIATIDGAGHHYEDGTDRAAVAVILDFLGSLPHGE